jgi:hypothetical protein
LNSSLKAAEQAPLLLDGVAGLFPLTKALLLNLALA